MSSAAARATRRVLVDQAVASETAAVAALQTATQIGLEWRAFSSLTFIGRLRWLLTGRLLPSTPNQAEALAAREAEGKDLAHADAHA